MISNWAACLISRQVWASTADKICRIDTRRSGLNALRVSETCWFVAHTKPRREKKFAETCSRNALSVTLPCYDSVKKYRGKTAIFRKPLFPGYVFLRLDPARREAALNDHLVRLLEVSDQEKFSSQLEDILLALEAGVGIRLAPAVEEGVRVRIKGGPLQGIEGYVERRSGMTTVILRLDFINQAAAVRVEADLLELI